MAHDLAAGEVVLPAMLQTRVRDRRGDWREATTRRLRASDAAALAAAAFGAHLLVGVPHAAGQASARMDVPVPSAAYWAAVCGFPIVWWVMLGLWGARDARKVGAGRREGKRIILASTYLLGAVSIASYAWGWDVAHSYVLAVWPLGFALLCATRLAQRRRMAALRAEGSAVCRVVLLGGPAQVDHLRHCLSLPPHTGYVPVAGILPGGAESLEPPGAGARAAEGGHSGPSAAGAHAAGSPPGTVPPGLPLFRTVGGIEDVLSLAVERRADAVAVTGGSGLDPSALRELGWRLAEHHIDLIIAPELVDVAGPRIHVEPLAGLPLIHVGAPRLEGGQALAKRAFDVVASGVGLVVFAPLMLLAAALVRIENRGGAVFRQQRVGRAGEPFTMLKLRSMVADAEGLLPHLLMYDDGNGVLFKMRRDPRVTRVGAWIRRYSIDELPQLWNVFVGDMSLVGPRPHLVAETSRYGGHVHRRHLVKPGITGLWQVSGRSRLSWEESVRLDLYYVENWSLLQDVSILLRTVRVVLTRDGAY
ncbi:MAG: sugar transferase [Arthrobacter sp.]|uniref:sugar transferase n=1 Tax=Arthrobacter sp. TaxID=1667 RepID=UPI00346D000B